MNHWHERHLLIGLALGSELIISKGEEITLIGLVNSGTIPETGIKLYCHHIMGKVWGGCWGLNQVLNIVFFFNCSTFKLISFSNNYTPFKMLTPAWNTFTLLQNGTAQSLHCFNFRSVVELLFLPSHLEVTSHCVKAKPLLLSTFNIFSLK